MFWLRPWNVASVMRLVSGLLICFGVSSSVPILLSALLGSSRIQPQDIRDGKAIAQILGATTDATNQALVRLRSRLSAADRQSLSEAAGTNSLKSQALNNALTNVLNRALKDPELRATSFLQSPALSARAASLARGAHTDLQWLQLNRQILQDALGDSLRPPRHAIEVSEANAFFIPSICSTCCLYFGFLWVMCRFLKDESLTWRGFLASGATAPGSAILPGVATGLAGAVLMLPVSMASSWIWKHLDHEPQLQQPLVLLQQASHPLQQMTFVLIALAAAPFLEEIFFRGLLYTTLRHAGWDRAAWILSAAAFGAIHFDREKFLPLTLLAVMFTAVYERTRTLVGPIIAHATFNTVNLLLFLSQSQNVSP